MALLVEHLCAQQTRLIADLTSSAAMARLERQVRALADEAQGRQEGR
jgi:hypothetical protein